MLWDPLGAWPAGRRWLWALLAVLVCFAQGPAFLKSLCPSRNVGIDFFQEWASARNVISRLPTYTNHRISAKKYLGYELRTGDNLSIELNAHPPTSVILGIPFALFDYPEATLAWNLFSLATLMSSLVLVWHELDLRFQAWAFFPLISLLLLCNPFRQQVLQGQLNLILLLILICMWISERNERPWLAGLLLGAATSIKLFPGFLFLYFTLRRKWVIVAAGLLWVAALNLLTMALLGLETYRSYLFDVIPTLSQFRSSWLNASLVGFWTKVFDTGATHYSRQVKPILHNAALARSGLILSYIVLLVVWSRAVGRTDSRGDCDRAFGLSLTVMLLISPITWDHYLLLATLPVILIWVRLPQSALMRTLFLTILACFWVNPAELWPIFLPSVQGPANVIVAPVQLLTLLSFQCYALIGLFILSLVIQRSESEGALGRGRDVSLQATDN